MEQHPLIIVFYLDEDMMRQPEIIQPFAESINEMLIYKKVNVLAFFIPTKGEERVECINPVVLPEADVAKVYKMIEDIKESFAIGVDIDIADEEVDLDVQYKPCECGNNPDGACQC